MIDEFMSGLSGAEQTPMFGALNDEEAARAKRGQAQFSEWFAELREYHRLVHMYPFYQSRIRSDLGEQLTAVLRLTGQTVGLPEAEVSWRMTKPQFELLLRDFAVGLGVPSADDALDARHVDRLHYKWLDLALARNFDFTPKQRGSGELDLGQALKRGGSLVRIRWMNAKSYAVGREAKASSPPPRARPSGIASNISLD